MVESTHLQVFILAAASLAWAFGVYADRIKAVVAPPLLVVAAGVVLGMMLPTPIDRLLDLVGVLAWVAVGIGVTGIALRFRREDLRQLWRPAFVLIGAAMLGMWAIATALCWALLRVDLAFAAVLGAILTPTDPVIASSIRHRPVRPAQHPPPAAGHAVAGIRRQ